MNKIREYRLKLSLSQTELGRQVGLVQGYISQLELGHVKPWPKAVRDLCRAFGVSEEELFPADNPAEPEEYEPADGLVHIVAYLDSENEEAQAWFQEYGEVWQKKHGVTIYPSLSEALQARAQVLRRKPGKEPTDEVKPGSMIARARLLRSKRLRK